MTQTTAQPKNDSVAGLLAAVTGEASTRDDNAAVAALDAARREEGGDAQPLPPPPAKEDITLKGEPVLVVPSPTEPVKRGRGRPRRDGTDNATQPATPPRSTKADLARELELAREETQRVRNELHAVQARANTDAVNGLAGVLAAAIHTASRFAAAKRGRHWLYEKAEAQDNGDAWAVVLAPYSEQLQKHLPLGLAILVTWNGLQKRLDMDAEIAEAARAKEESGGGAQST